MTAPGAVTPRSDALPVTAFPSPSRRVTVTVCASAPFAVRDPEVTETVDALGPTTGDPATNTALLRPAGDTVVTALPLIVTATVFVPVVVDVRVAVYVPGVPVSTKPATDTPVDGSAVAASELAAPVAANPSALRSTTVTVCAETPSATTLPVDTWNVDKPAFGGSDVKVTDTGEPATA